jgi:hypothetical protein
MDVFLVPVGGDRHDLYCEVTAEVEPVAETAERPGWWQRQVRKFRQTLAEAEEERHHRERGLRSERRGVWRFVVGKLAEAVAEQRLLWHLRRETSATLVHADTLTGPAALGVARRQLTADRDKHRRWCAIDAVLTIATAPVALLPGPNFLAYYFMFRTGGHYLSMRGAERGLNGVTWRLQPSRDLTELGAALALDPDARQRRVEELAASLGLDRLAAFVNRVARRPT